MTLKHTALLSLDDLMNIIEGYVNKTRGTDPVRHVQDIKLVPQGPGLDSLIYIEAELV